MSVIIKAKNKHKEVVYLTKQCRSKFHARQQAVKGTIRVK